MADNSGRTTGSDENIRTVQKGGGSGPKTGVVILDVGGSGAEAVGAIGNASGIFIQDNGNSITVDNGGTFAVQATVSGTPAVDTELPAAAALADATANPTVPTVGADAMLYNGATWDRMRGDTANGLDVDVTRVSGTVTVSVSNAPTVDTELPAAAAMSDTISRTLTTPQVGAMLMIDNASNYVRAPGDLTNGLDVDVTRVTGTVTVDTELAAAAAMSDTISRTLSTAQAGALLMIDNGANYVRAPGDLTNGLDVDVTRVSGTVTVDTEMAAAAAMSDTISRTLSTAQVGALAMLDNGANYVRAPGDVTGGAFVQGNVAADAAVSGKPLLDGGRASKAIPTAMSTDGDAVPIWLDLSGAVIVSPRVVSTATLTNVATSTTSATLLASNTARKGAIIYNDSAVVMYVKFGATASATSLTYALAAGETLELPGATVLYTGIIDGVLASSTGNARVTELT